MKKTTIYIALATLCLFLNTKAHSQKNNTQPLSVGDSIPEEVWNIPLQVVNHPDGKKTITLNAYREKLLILDFWGTYCGSCIAAMPYLDSLNKALNNQVYILPVNKEPKAKVETFFKNNTTLISLKIQSVVDANILKSLFPHTMVPHEVWIMNGVVKAITNSDYVNIQYIKKILNSSLFSLPLKKDILDFNSAKPFLTNTNGGSDTSFLYRSIFTRYKSGLPSVSGAYLGKNEKQWRVYAINATVIQLYSLAFKQIASLPPNRIKIRIPSMHLSQPNIEGQEREKWNFQNLYCYELNLPVSTEDYLEETIKQDINRYLGLNGRIELHEGLEYFILEPIDTLVKQKLN